ncbi:uncharacterized protein LOC142574072 [Dermacentor variabilis]|uniref:uncharacterized protein LOC142574072 n=1 Tax=Dermacentor variabilis TaxID=34621 RepID=UPI003F5BD121
MIPVFAALLLAFTLKGSGATVIFPQVVPQLFPHVPPVLVHQLVRTNVVPAVSVNDTTFGFQPPLPNNGHPPPVDPTRPAPDEAGNCTSEADDKKSVPPAVPGPFVPVRLPFVPVGPVVRTVPYVPGYGFGYVPCFNCPRFALGNGFLPYGFVG